MICVEELWNIMPIKALQQDCEDPTNLFHYEAYKSAKDAENRERKIKSYGQAYRRLKERLDDSLK